MDEEVSHIFGLEEKAEETSVYPNVDTQIQSALADDANIVSKSVPSTTPMTSLANYVMARFKENEDFRNRSGITDRLNYCIRSNRCEFSEEQRQKLLTKFPEEVIKRIFIPITSTKIRAARAMLVDLINQSGDPLFRIEPSPSPTVPEEVAQAAFMASAAELQMFFTQLEQRGVQQLQPEAMIKIQQLVKTITDSKFDDISTAKEGYARIRAGRMQKKVWDLMLEGGFKDAFIKYIDDICAYGTGVIVGPVVRNVHKNICKTDKNGTIKYRRVTKAIPIYESVSPFDCYPAPDAKNVDDGAFCMTVKYTADTLSRYVDTKSKNDGGWIFKTVNSLLAKHPRGGVKLNIKNFEVERRYCENNGFDDTNDCTFEGVRCFSAVRGSELLGMGINKNLRGKTIDASSFYKTETIVIDNVVVYCRIYDDEMDVPVSRGVFYTVPGSWWGASIAEKISSCQLVLNNCIRALLQNMPLASGPIIWVNEAQRLVNRTPGALRIQAGDVLAFGSSMTGNTGAPMGSLSIPSNASELLNVFNRMQTQADLDSGLPAYTEGQSAGQSGALRTASGLAMYTEASNRGMKMVMHTTDNMVINRIARMTADWVLLNDDDMDLKGDVDIFPVGLVGKVLKAQRDQQRLQLLQLVLNSQILTQALGIKGILEMFRPSIQDIDLNPNDIMPSKGRMDTLEQIEGIKQIFDATSAAQGVQQNAGADAQGGGAPGVAMPEKPQAVQGGVAERRAVA